MAQGLELACNRAYRGSKYGDVDDLGRGVSTCSRWLVAWSDVACCGGVDCGELVGAHQAEEGQEWWGVKGWGLGEPLGRPPLWVCSGVSRVAANGCVDGFKWLAHWSRRGGSQQQRRCLQRLLEYVAKMCALRDRKGAKLLLSYCVAFGKDGSTAYNFLTGRPNPFFRPPSPPSAPFDRANLSLSDACPPDVLYVGLDDNAIVVGTEKCAAVRGLLDELDRVLEGVSRSLVEFSWQKRRRVQDEMSSLVERMEFSMGDAVRNFVALRLRRDCSIGELKRELGRRGLSKSGSREQMCSRLSYDYDGQIDVYVGDPRLFKIPFEAMPCLAQATVTRRIPTTATKLNPPGQSILPVIDPEGNLPRTRDTMTKAVEEFEKGDSVLLYCGHGTGRRHWKHLAPTYQALLMGCSSARLPVLHALFDRGTVNVVATLWDVSDKDLDCLTVHLLKDLVTRGDGHISKHLRRARQECKLQLINAHAVVCFGPLAPRTASKTSDFGGGPSKKINFDDEAGLDEPQNLPEPVQQSPVVAGHARDDASRASSPCSTPRTASPAPTSPSSPLTPDAFQ